MIQSFHRYREETGDPVAAALLVLAEALSADDADLSVAQAAERLGVSGQTVRNLIRAGDLRAHRVGAGRGTIRIRPEELASVQEQVEPETLPGEVTLETIRRLTK